MSSEDNSQQTASVDLDKDTLLKFESHLRDSLVASQYFLAADNKSLTAGESGSTVKVDAAQAARLSEQLRQHLVDTNAISPEDHEALTKLTSQVK